MAGQSRKSESARKELRRMRYNPLNQIAIVSILGYTTDEKEAVDLALEPMINAGVKFAVLRFEECFLLEMHNLDENEQQSVIDEITAEYNFCLNN